MSHEEKQTDIVLAKPTAYELAAFKQIEELTVEMARADIWPQAPIEAVRKAVHIAKARGANPWCDEIYLIPRRSEGVARWVTQMSQNYVIKVATGHPACAGWQDGVIVQNAEGTLQQLDGGFVPKGWTLVGAWFKGYRKGFQVPITKRINVEDYDTGKPGPWTKIKSTMLIKVARTQGLREMLPDRLSGMYDAAEMNQMGDIIEVDGVPAEAAKPPALPATPPAPRGRPPKNAPEPAAEPTGKDEDHIKGLTTIVMGMANNNVDAGRELLRKWSTFPTLKGKPIESFKDPRLKGKWLNRIIITAREEYAKFLFENPEVAGMQPKEAADEPQDGMPPDEEFQGEEPE